jgi:large subunit ribosomal protein L6
MSRVGNKAINFTEGVTITVSDDNTVLVKGPKGEISFKFSPRIKFEIVGNTVNVSRPTDEKEDKIIHGTSRAILHNMVEGVTSLWTKSLLIEGTGYKANLRGDTVVVAAGYSHLVEMKVPQGITAVLPSQTEVILSGIDKQAVGQFAAEIRAIRGPEPYKGKGIRYKTEIIRRKEGKKAK